MVIMCSIEISPSDKRISCSFPISSKITLKKEIISYDIRFKNLHHTEYLDINKIKEFCIMHSYNNESRIYNV